MVAIAPSPDFFNKGYSRLQVREVQPFGESLYSGTLKGAAIQTFGVPHAPAKRYIVVSSLDLPDFVVISCP